MADSPTHDELLALLRGEITGAEAERLHAKALSDPRAAALLTLLREIRDTLVEEPSLRPPADVMAKVKALMAPQHPAPGLAERLSDAVGAVARLLFDSASAPAALGFRGGAGTRHLTYATGGAEVDLLITASPSPEGTLTVTGQIEPAGAGGALVTFVHTGRPGTLEARSDNAGVFRLALPRGVYGVRIEREGGAIAIDAVPVEV